jgi:hypothetical protein
MRTRCPYEVEVNRVAGALDAERYLARKSKEAHDFEMALRWTVAVLGVTAASLAVVLFLW